RPWTRLLAQLPTPTMATRILPSLRRAEPAHVLDGARPLLAPLPFLPLVATMLSVLPLVDRRLGGRLGLAADMKDPLDDGDSGAEGDDAEGECEDTGSRLVCPRRPRRPAFANGKTEDPRQDEPEGQDHEPDLA